MARSIRMVVPSLVISLLFLFLLWNRTLPTLTLQTKTHQLNDQIIIQIPVSTEVKYQEQYTGSDIIYSVYLDDPLLFYHGYIQLWNLQDLKAFLEKSYETSTYDFIFHELKPFSLHDYEGYIDEWTAVFGQLYSISGKEYWLQKKEISLHDRNLTLRISLFTKASAFSTDQTDMACQILNSLEWN